MMVGVVIHIFCVGLPISLSVRRFSRWSSLAARRPVALGWWSDLVV